MSSIFISYRREDSDIWVGRLADELRKHFPPDQIFQDIASIDPGAEFPTVLNEALGKAAAMLVVIGPRWLSATDRQGRKRLENATDFVRQEIAESLGRPGVRVFPVLVGGAEMPAEEDLPAPLKPLALRHAYELTVRHWSRDTDQLVEILKRVPGLGSNPAAVRDAPRGPVEQPRKPEESASKEDAQRHIVEEQAKQRAAEEQRRLAEEDAHRRAQEETLRAAEEQRRLAEEDANRRAQAEALRAAEEQRRLAEADAHRRAQAETLRAAEEQRRLAEEDAHRRAQAETLRAAEEQRRLAEEDAHRRAQAEAPRAADQVSRQLAATPWRKWGVVAGIGVLVLVIAIVGRRSTEEQASNPPPQAASVEASATNATSPVVPTPTESPVTKGTSIKIGILHSLSGTMAPSEAVLKDVALMAIDEINAKGGVMGVKIEAVVVDPASNWPLFAEKARQLLAQDKVAVVFGCWTSVTRKAVRPVFEELNGLLFYPVRYEGEVASRNVFYTGAVPNQQAIPAVEYLMSKEGGAAKRWVLLGTDYVYPRTTNRILRAFLKSKGVAEKDIDEKYTPFGHSDYQTIVADIRKFAAGGKTAVVSTINGDSNVPFYKELGDRGLKPTDVPVVALSVGEEELRGVDIKPLVGHLAAATYFMSLKNPANDAFVKKWAVYAKQRRIPGHANNPLTNDPMEATYIGVHMWKQAAERAKSFDPAKVSAAMSAQTFAAPSGMTVMMDQWSHHLQKPVFVGQIEPNGQFKVVWASRGLVVALP